MGDPVSIPGGRDVRAVLDTADATALVVACPPDPRQRGNRSDPRLVAVSDALAEEEIGCLRIDYGSWDDGYGEREDARNALRWALEEYDRVGIYGYSFGAAIALLAAATVEHPPQAVSVLAPPPRLAPDLDTVVALESYDGPVQVLYGSRDSTVDAAAVVDRARTRDAAVVELPADHFFLGAQDRIGELVASFFVEELGQGRSTS